MMEQDTSKMAKNMDKKLAKWGDDKHETDRKQNTILNGMKVKVQESE